MTDPMTRLASRVVLVSWPLSPPGPPYPLRGGVDQGPVEAGGLGIQGQHELLLLE